MRRVVEYEGAYCCALDEVYDMNLRITLRTAHEVLGVYQGKARVQLGGGKGMLVDVGPGDVVIIPAGVVHKNIRSSSDFRMFGAYPKGQRWDMNYEKVGERPKADSNIVVSQGKNGEGGTDEWSRVPGPERNADLPVREGGLQHRCPAC